MKKRKKTDRRAGFDRRLGGDATYTGTERRKLKHRRLGLDRRGLLPNVCIYCGKVCGDGGGWYQGDSTAETTVECRNGICADCSSEKFPQYQIKR